MDAVVPQHDALIQLRRELHAIPEVGLNLPQTQALLLSALEGLPLEITLGHAATSITAVLRGTHPERPTDAPAVLLRGDMDGLPVDEPADAAFRSQNEGVMHACGHDLHMAMLVGAAHELSARRAELLGDVVFMFQPGEEGWGGAGIMIAEGVLDAAGPRVGSAFGIHVFTGDPRPARLGIKPGPAMAYGIPLTVEVIGRGGHGSAPHLASDPITTAAEIVLALQTASAHRFDPFDPVVVTIGQIEAGSARNVIPSSARLAGSVRGFSHESQARAAMVLPAVAHGVAAAHGQLATVEFEQNFSVLINSPADTATAIAAATARFGGASIEHLEHPKTASEDFAEILAEVPGVFVFLDATPAKGSDNNHSANAIYDDAVLSEGAQLHAEFALRRLTELCASAAAAGSPTTRSSSAF